MRVRLFLLPFLALALAALADGAAAQPAGKVYRIGFLTIGGSQGPIAVAARDGLGHALARRGYSVGVDLIIESRFAEGEAGRLPELVKQLVDSRVDLIVAEGYLAARAAKDGAPTVPIVVSDAGDPVETGLVASLSHPGGNITGISDMSSELSAKRVELLNAAVPGLRHAAMLWNTDDLGMTARLVAAMSAARRLGIELQSLYVRDADDLDAAIGEMARKKPEGILTVTDVLTILNWKRLFDFAASHRLPAIYEFDLLARQGGLMSYGPDEKETAERAADLVVRILNGAKPADLPFEQPTRFRFVINLNTAKALGFTIPQNLLARADEVIE
jgi:putative ABC transport system substrate-binding protein